MPNPEKLAVRQIKVEVRERPAADAPVIATYPRNTELQIVEDVQGSDGAWIRVRSVTGKEGFIPGTTQLGPAPQQPAEGGVFAPEQAGINKGVVGGIIMILIAVVWFVVGWMGGIIFFYPPILAVIGIYAVVKGLATGNVAGRQ